MRKIRVGSPTRSFQLPSAEITVNPRNRGETTSRRNVGHAVGSLKVPPKYSSVWIPFELLEFQFVVLDCSCLHPYKVTTANIPKI